MQMPTNKFKQALAQRRPQFGLFMGLANPISAEILATCGYDFLLIDAEHGLNDTRCVQTQLQAMAPYPVQCLVRPASHDPALIKQILGTGVQTLLVPMVDTAEHARAIVSSMHYPPKGIRGVGTGLERGARWNAISDYFAKGAEELCLIVQIESRTALENLDEIAAVEGVDAVFIGPSDLAASLGYLGRVSHPDVKAAIEDALTRIASHGKAAGVFCADASLAASYQASGAHFVALGADTGLLRSAAIKLLDSVQPQSGNANVGAGY
ncbi:HpcH/HpaI aldolase family protein [Pusillimonas noertemannii]|uniref:2,4-dihydroxyhept-2-enedioate aldolase n=1 Tax=Pusillimonas noertemannii TaxID=305977 RepID=A0A2U1CL27_9BURK|nr:HpcH/HpaI aldolase/citrate lyase family protein [Pusillimonas noertemannii]NYT69252.1 HpcH/HpaI aldolase/citrate lyase family protein [Pusillimonas noertemannii]PVY61719.1 2,4-dihydroxyhept-2-enedioate aldolase [Pusillimonas noertemannii]TFL09658.1 2-keto-3-deoxy-L-rhamnonate aldolase [Pusillimonas noertemannii]